MDNPFGVLPSDVQLALRDGANRFLSAQRAALDTAADRSTEPPNWWQELVALGWPALLFSSARGGLDGSDADLAVIMEAFGRADLSLPFLGSAVVCTILLEQLPPPASHPELSTATAEGSVRLALAHDEAAPASFTRASRISGAAGDLWRLDGSKRLVLEGAYADQLIVSAREEATGPSMLFLVPVGTPGIILRNRTILGGYAASELDLRNVDIGADCLLAADGDDALQSALDRAALALAFDAVGACEALLEKTVEHVRTRQQFGKALSTFQAIRHHIADMAVACDEARSIALRATLVQGSAVDRMRAASAAKWKATACARLVAEKAVQIHGAMGISEEMPIGGYLRRVLASEFLFGSPDWHLDRYAQSADAAPGAAERDTIPGGLDEQHAAFRTSVRDFVRRALPDDLRQAQRDLTETFARPGITNAWLKILNANGWAAPLWPAEHGGPGWSSLQRFIFESECAIADAPVLFPQGVRHVGPLLIRYGTDAQRARFLPRILNGDDYWCQGYSEPGAGSDLASLTTRAVRNGDDYVVNGSKIWTTDAHLANWMFALVRTSAEGRKQEGISILLMPMDTPGISVSPLRSISGHHELNQVFLDDVRVPVTNLVGEEGKGWECGKYVLEFERGGSFVSPRLSSLLRNILSAPAERPADPRRVAQFEIAIEALEMTELRVAAGIPPGGNPGQYASILKLKSSLLRQDIARFAVEMAGSRALDWSLDAGGGNDIALTRHLTYRAYTIFAGTSEIQRDIIARTVGL